MENVQFAPGDRKQDENGYIFFLQRIEQGLWSVAYRGSDIPGALMHSKSAARRYVVDIARAAGLHKVWLVIGNAASGSRSPRGG